MLVYMHVECCCMNVLLHITWVDPKAYGQGNNYCWSLNLIKNNTTLSPTMSPPLSHYVGLVSEALLHPRLLIADYVASLFLAATLQDKLCVD